jgi:Lipase (class 3)
MGNPLNCVLACACGTSYGIDPATGNYTPVEPYSGVVNFNSAPTAINSTGSDRINACLVGKNANGIIVAFRGTIPPTDADSIPDWLEDFFTVPTTCGSLPGKVHSGFCHDIQTIISGVIAAVQSLDPALNKVYVTGHSKGGALASLGAYLLSAAGIPVEQVITFASPRTGDPDFKAGYQKVIPNQIRYENYGDLVPLVPPSAPFIGGLAAVVKLVPGIGEKLAALILEADGWDYVAVGQEYFIESAADKYAINTSEKELDQVGAFILNLTKNGFDIAKTLANAHSISCGYGYMSGACPSSVCGGATQS